MNRNHPGWLILLLTGLLAIVASSANASPHHARHHAAIQGRWVASPIPGLNWSVFIPVAPWCERFTRNLNEFQTLSFNTCSPRLSKKYPELRRPRWTRIPWNRALAKKVFMVGSSFNPPGYEQGWHHWLEQTRALRQAGKVHLWQTTADLLGNGQKETLIRLDHSDWGGIVIRRGRKVMLPLPHFCRYYDSQLYLMPPKSAPPKTRGRPTKAATPVLSATTTLAQRAQLFDTYSSGYNDVLYDARYKRYFFLAWHRYPLPMRSTRIATGSVEVSGPHVRCDINWVPTHPAPTKPSSTTPIRLAH